MTEQRDRGESHEHGAQDGQRDDERGGHHAHDADSVAVAVVTVSSTRTRETDAGGDAVVAAVEDAGHRVVSRDVVADDVAAIGDAVATAFDSADADAVVTTGGTGLTPDDVTVDALRDLFDRSVPGFGELFRRLSYEEVGPMAMASRATAGVVDDRLVFCLPGSESAARLGARELIAPAVGHLLGLVRR